MKNIYVAAPLFSVWERDRNQRFGEALQEAGYNPLLPQSIEAPRMENGQLDMRFVFKECVRLLDESDAVTAFCEGPDVDSGTAWELGYAAAKGIPSLCVRTDMRKAEADAPANIMLAYGATEMLYLPSYHGTVTSTTEAVVRKIGEILREDIA
jgi:nucleoside 2-deoxyribosyltransferase